VPKQCSTGGKPRLGPITKRGNGSFAHPPHSWCAFGAALHGQTDGGEEWGGEEVGQRRGENIAAVALAAKHARILWALLAGGQEYRGAA